MIVIVAAAGIEGPSFSSLESNLFLGLMGASRLEWKPCEWFEEYCGFSAAQYRAGTLLPRLLFLLAPRWSSFFHREKMIPATLSHADEIENWLAHPRKCPGLIPVSAGKVIVRNLFTKSTRYLVENKPVSLELGQRWFTRNCSPLFKTNPLPVRIGPAKWVQQNAKHVRTTCSLSFACRFDGQKLALLNLQPDWPSRKFSPVVFWLFFLCARRHGIS